MIQLRPDRPKSILHNSEGPPHNEEKGVWGLNLFFAHIASVWELVFMLSWVRYASYRVFQVKQTTLGGSVVLQMSFRGQLPIVGFLEHNCWNPSLTV